MVGATVGLSDGVLVGRGVGGLGRDVGGLGRCVGGLARDVGGVGRSAFNSVLEHISDVYLMEKQTD